MDPICHELARAADEVWNDCFPGDATDADILDVLAFMLGIPTDQVDEFMDRTSQGIERRTGKTPTKQELYLHTAVSCVALGRASERLNKVTVP